MLKNLLLLLAFVLSSAGAQAQSDTIWAKNLNGNSIRDCHFTTSGDSIIVIATGDVSEIDKDTVSIIQTSTGDILKKTGIAYGPGYRFCLFHNSTKMVINGINYKTYIYDYATESVIADLSYYHTPSVAISPDDSEILIARLKDNETNAKLMIYDVVQNSFTDSIIVYGSITTMDISQDGQLLATNALTASSQDDDRDKLILRRMDNFEIIKDFDGNPHQGAIVNIRFSPDNKYIGIARFDGTVRVYRTESLDLFRSFTVSEPSTSNGPVKVCFSSNSQYLIGGLGIWANFTTKLWNISNNELTYTYNTSSYHGLDVNGNDNIIAGGNHDLVLLAPKWLSVDDKIQRSQSYPSYIISKSSGNNFQFDDEFIDCFNYELFDYFGNIVITGKNCSEINPGTLACGLYFLKINSRCESRVIKVLVVE
jgi:WD40 repeat protein